MIEALHGGEVRRLYAASPGCGAPAAALPSTESSSADAYARHRLFLFSRVASAPAERAAELLPQSLGAVCAQVDDGFALHVLARVIIVIGQRRVEAVAEEFDLVHGEAAFAADIFWEGDALAVFEHSRLAVHFDRKSRTIRALDAEHADALKIRAVVAARLDAPRAQLLGQIGGGQPQTFRKRGAPFQFVRSQI